jgi:hypothetical protein
MTRRKTDWQFPPRRPDWETPTVIDARIVESALAFILDAPAFVVWIDRVRDTVQYRGGGHLIYDLKRDNTLPATFSCLAEFRAYLEYQGACWGAVVMAPVVWRRYRRWVERRIGEARS